MAAVFSCAVAFGNRECIKQRLEAFLASLTWAGACSTLEAVAFALASNVHLVAFLEDVHEFELLPRLVTLCILHLRTLKAGCKRKQVVWLSRQAAELQTAATCAHMLCASCSAFSQHRGWI